jgi:hypothetical protein
MNLHIGILLPFSAFFGHTISQFMELGFIYSNGEQDKTCDRGHGLTIQCYDIQRA